MSADNQADEKKSAQHRSAWIVSPSWDMAYIVAPPLAIVPVVIFLAHRYATPETIWLLVIAFASLGHHLPGFMRAYGDRELFARFRWRFLLAPPILLITALVFLVPTFLTDPAAALASPEIAFSRATAFSGLELIAAFWGTWHGLMQLYGFMRIYDIKRGVNRRGDGWMDFSLCLAIFACGVVFSQSRVYSIMEVMWRTGIPQFGPQWLLGLRWIVGIATAAIVVVYLARMFSADRRALGVTWAKIILALTTGGIYWIAGALTTNVLIGVAMFEIFHAVQYNAFVWAYNRKRRDRSGSRFGPLGFMFQDRWSMLGMYLAAIAAFGAIRFFTNGVESPVTQSLLLAFFTASTLLHYYYDGFIWKVSERTTQRNLDVAASTAWRDQLRVPGMVHFGKWAALYGILIGLFLLEQTRGAKTAADHRQRLAQLVAWSPELPELLIVVSKEKLKGNDVDGSIEAAQKAFALRPRSHLAASTLGDALHRGGKNKQARDAFRRAIRLKPQAWSHHFTLGVVSLELGEAEAARRAFDTVLAMRPEDAAACDVIAEAYQVRGRNAEAIRLYRRALQIDSRFVPAMSKLAQTLAADGQHKEAITLARQAIATAPKSRTAHHLLGIVMVSVGQYDQAIGPFEQAIKLGLHTAQIDRQLGIALIHTGQLDRAESILQRAIDLEPQSAASHFQMGNVMFFSGRMEAAVISFGRATRLDPKLADGYVNLGAAYQYLGRLRAAETAYRKGLSLDPGNANAHYNLGLILWSQQKPNEARESIVRARELGLKISPEVAAALGL